jgi:hypothetical protein
MKGDRNLLTDAEGQADTVMNRDPPDQNPRGEKEHEFDPQSDSEFARS